MHLTYYYEDGDEADSFLNIIVDATVSFSSSNTNYGTVNQSSVSVSPGSTLTVSSNTVTVGGTTCTATKKTVTGYNTAFSNWQYSTNGGTSWTNLTSSITITGNTSVRAVFTGTPINYTVSFTVSDSTYGQVSKSSQSAAYNSTLTVSSNTITVGGATITATAKTVTGWNTSFSKWQYSTNNSTWSDLTANRTITGNLYVKAIFNASVKTYAVKYYDGDNKLISDWTQNVQHGGTIAHTTYSATGKVFCGWYSESSHTNLFNTSTQVTKAYNLYAYMVDVLAFTTSPVADASITYASTLGLVLFDALESQSAARVLWDFGDGTYGNEIVMYHHYEQPGTYNVLLSVYNSEGEMDTHTYDVIVYDTADGPPGNDNTLLIAGSIVAALVAGFIIARPF